MSIQSPRPRIGILLAKKQNPQLAAQITAGESPRVEYLELQQHLGATLLDYNDVEQAPSPLVRSIARRLGPRWGLAWLAFQRRREWDQFYATGEDIAIPLAMLFRLVRLHERITAVVHNCGTPNRRRLFRRLGHAPFRHLVVIASAQERILTNDLQMPRSKVARIPYWIDHRFYTPQPTETDGSFLSVGLESRDYTTLEAAVRGLPYQFTVVASGWSPSSGFTAATGIETGSNIRVLRGLSFAELRDLYARASGVIAPLDNVTSAAGVTSMFEGMAMGKPIIVSRSPGILDYVQDNVSALSVATGDPMALRQAIETLGAEPERATAMGRYNRQWVEQAFTMEHYLDRASKLLA